MQAPLTDPAILAAVRGFRHFYGPRLRELVLFGSRARGDAHEESDYDLLVVVDELSSQDQRRADEVCGDILTELDAIVVPFLLDTTRASELRQRERRIMREIAREGVSLMGTSASA